MFDKCLDWLQQQPEATPYNTSVLMSLKEIAAKKRYCSLKQKKNNLNKEKLYKHM